MVSWCDDRGSATADNEVCRRAEEYILRVCQAKEKGLELDELTLCLS